MKECNITIERRMYKRFLVKLNARYLQGKDETWKECFVTNVSREGMGIIIYLKERMPINSSLQLEIILDKKGEVIKATGIMRWVKEHKEGSNFEGGIEFTKIDSEDKWTLLDHAYDDWYSKETE